MLCLLGLLGWTLPAHAQTPRPVYRCVGAHGELVFSGRPCGAPAAAGSAGTGTERGGMPGAACMATPAALRQAIGEAFAGRDVNRLAGLMVWQGIDTAVARALLQSLSDWLHRPLIGIAIAYPAVAPQPAAVPPAMTGTAPPAAAFSAAIPTGIEVSTGGDGGGVRTFAVVQSGGCWWLVP